MDWDLSAIVKSCSNHTTPKQTTRIEATSSSNKGFGYLDALNSEDEDDTFFGFLDLINNQNNGVQKLQNSCLPSNGDGTNVVVNSSVPDIGAISGPIQQQVVQNYYQPPPLPPQPPETTVSIHQRQPPFHYQWQQWHHQRLGFSNNFPMNMTQASPSRSRNVKKGEKKVIQVAAEDLCSDAWQWRKYGQKPIKGSPFPRNYYRCSSSKACAARKQVERSHVDSNMFKVTYSGEHTAFCPPPNPQFPLARDAPISQYVANNEPAVVGGGGGEIGGISPVEVEVGDDVDTDDWVEVGGGDSAGDGEDLLIPNFNALNDELLKGFQQLGGTLDDGN